MRDDVGPLSVHRKGVLPSFPLAAVETHVALVLAASTPVVIAGGVGET